MAAPTQKPPTAPKTRLGLSLAERIKVIEARQMGKSMRQVRIFLFIQINLNFICSTALRYCGTRLVMFSFTACSSVWLR